MFNVQWKNSTFAPAFKTSKHWRDGRVVDYSSLENYRTERYRGFESLSLRKVEAQSFDDQTVAFLIYSLHPFLHPLLGLSSWADEEADIREIQQEEQVPCCLPQPYGNGFEYQLQDNG